MTNEEYSPKIYNGRGPKQEQTSYVSVKTHRVLELAWISWLWTEGKLRNPDGLTSSVKDFCHPASVELENNSPREACGYCRAGGCVRWHHMKNDSTGVRHYWNRANYESTDHTYGVGA